MATEGRDKGGKLALITSRLNAGEVRARRGRTKGGKTKRAGNLDSPFPVMTGSFPSAVCLRRHHDEDVSISSSVTLARFSTEENDTSFGISLDDFWFPLTEDRRVKKGEFKRRIKICRMHSYKRNIISNLD